MSLFITSLASGSNGNCYYIGNEKEAILVDAGISCREIEKRMKRLGLSMAKLKTVFISHEHSDHIRGIHSLVKKHYLPVYITMPTLKNGGLYLENHSVKSFIAYSPVTIGNLSITAFPKFHDASDPYSFTVSCNGLKVGVFTDIGLPCEHVIRNFSECHAAFLETNYDEEMLDNGNYPYHLKKRIQGEKGHLSKNNNCPELVSKLFTANAGDIKVIVASRYKETAVYQIQAIENSIAGIHYRPVAEAQLAFSF